MLREVLKYRIRLIIVAWTLMPISAASLGANTLTFESLATVTSYRNQNLEAYPEIHQNLSGGFIIPGLSANFVPQGLSTVPRREALLVSGYVGLSFKGSEKRISVKEKRSVLLLLDNDTGQLLAAASLREPSGAPMGRHAGGVYVEDGSIWVPSKNKLYRFSLAQLSGAAGTIIDLSPTKVLTIDSKGSFVSGMGEHLLVGEFIKERNQVPDYHQSPSGRHQAWTAVYNTNRLINEPERNPFIIQKEGTKLIRPDGVIHHRQKGTGNSYEGGRMDCP